MMFSIGCQFGAKNLQLAYFVAHQRESDTQQMRDMYANKCRG